MTSDVQPSEPAEELLAVARRVTAGWLRRAVIETAERAGGASPSLIAQVDDRVDDEAASVVERLATLLATDVDEQRTNPLTIFRDAVRWPTEVLLAHGVPAPPTDAFTSEHFPDDVYGLGPATWADIHPDLRDPGLVWGAWKAMTVLRRRRDDGLR